MDYVISDFFSGHLELIGIGTDMLPFINVVQFSNYHFHWWQKGVLGVLVLYFRRALYRKDKRKKVMVATGDFEIYMN